MSGGRQPQKAGPYELLSILGQGASGTVYLARRPGIERMFALKLLEANLDDDGRARVQREAQVASRLDHPGIVRVVDFGVLGPQLYIVMEHIPGPTLRDVLAQGSLPPERAASIVATIARAMDVAHAAGVVHRDLKPANVILDARDNKPKVTDFGLARDTRAAHQLTRPGEVIGTPYYMAPEQIHGSGVDARTDVYAIGVLLYELLTGRRPFEGKTVAAVVHEILNSAVVPPQTHNAAIPPALNAVCLRALARKPERRFPTAQALVQELEAPTLFSAREPFRIPPVFAAVLGGLCAGLVVLTAWAVLAFANARGKVGPLSKAKSDLATSREALLRATQDVFEAKQEARQARTRAEANRKLVAAQAKLKAQAERNAAPSIADEVAQAGMTPTGHLALIVDTLITDLESVEGTAALRGNLLYNRQRFQEASELYTQARAAGKTDPELAVVQFRASSRLGDGQAAEEAMRWVLSAHPDSVAAKFAGLVLGTTPLTTEDLHALQNDPKLKFNYLFNIEFMSLGGRGRIPEALEAARRAVEFDPCDTDAHLYIVSTLVGSWQTNRGVPTSADDLAEALHSYRVAADLCTGTAEQELQDAAGVLQTAVRKFEQSPR